MISSLGKSVAQHILYDNEKLNAQLIRVKKDLKLIQDKMMQALDNLSLNYSSKLNSCTKLLLFDTPYQCLAAFVEQMSTAAVNSIATADENSCLLKVNRNLKQKIIAIQTQLKQRNKNQQQTIKQLNDQIDQKRTKLQNLQEDYQQVLQAKKIAQKQLGHIKQHMKILQLKLYEQQRQKLTQIIVANKREMIEFRRSLQMQAYKQQLQYKKQMQEKDLQIRTLARNIEELISNKLTATSDLTVLQKIVKPIRDMTVLRNQIALLRKNLDQVKKQLRDKNGVVLGLEGKVADASLVRDNLASQKQRLQIERGLTQKQLLQTRQQLAKAIRDRQALDLYYTQKWHSEFSKVRDNVQQKYIAKSKQLQQQFEKRRKQVQAQIVSHIQRLRVMRGQLGEVRRKNQILSEMNARLLNEMNELRVLNAELRRVIREAEMFHGEELRVASFQLTERITLFKSELYQQRRITQHLQIELTSRLHQLQTSRNSFLLEKRQQLKKLNESHRLQIQTICAKHKREMEQLQKRYSRCQEGMQQLRISMGSQLDAKEKQLLQSHSQKLRQIHNLCDNKIRKVNQKLAQSEHRYQKLRKSKQEQLQQSAKKHSEIQTILHEKDLQIVSRDIQIAEYRKMKDNYMNEIAKLNNLLNEQTKMKESLNSQLEVMGKCVQEKQRLIKGLQSKRYMFKNQLQQFEKAYKKEFQSLMQSHRRLNNMNKKKIKELQNLFQRRPMKQQHFEKILSLEQKNSQLKTQIHLKQAQNLILNEVKDYYQQKAFTFSTSTPQHIYLPTERNQHFETADIANKQQLLSTCTFLKTSNSFLRPAQGTVSLVKKYRSRKNKLITSSYHNIEAPYAEEGKEEDSEIRRMKRYLSRQHQRGNPSPAGPKYQQVQRHLRTKSSLA